MILYRLENDTGIILEKIELADGLDYVQGGLNYVTDPEDRPLRVEEGQTAQTLHYSVDLGFYYQDDPLALEDYKTAEAASHRRTRDSLLTEADHKINTLEDGGLDAEAWKSYRQALRDVTGFPGFPLDFLWPVRPAEVS